MKVYMTVSIDGKWLCFPLLTEREYNRYSLITMSPNGQLFVLKAHNVTIELVRIQLARWMKIRDDDITYTGEERIKKRSKTRVLTFYVNTEDCPF